MIANGDIRHFVTKLKGLWTFGPVAVSFHHDANGGFADFSHHAASLRHDGWPCAGGLGSLRSRFGITQARPTHRLSKVSISEENGFGRRYRCPIIVGAGNESSQVLVPHSDIPMPVGISRRVTHADLQIGLRAH